jgi:hypothetical protein
MVNRSRFGKINGSQTRLPSKFSPLQHSWIWMQRFVILLIQTLNGGIFPYWSPFFPVMRWRRLKKFLLALPIRRICLYGGGTKNGVFPVKSAYHMLKEVEGRKIATGSSSRGSGEFWKQLWSLPGCQMWRKIFL